jgi:2-oxoglutarate dehydrogenase E2 component (dihydrolipoamide succinyltransferase)
MIVEIKIPSPGESIAEVVIANWFVADGEVVQINQEIAEIESDKATLSLSATAKGRIQIMFKAGETVTVGAIACKIDTSDVQEDEIPAQASTPTAIEEAKYVIVNEAEQKPAEESSMSKVKVSPLAAKIMEENHLSVQEVLDGLRRLSKQDVETVIKSLNNPEIKKEESKPEIIREKQEKPLSSLRKKLSERLVAVKNETAMLTTFNEVDMTNVMALRTDNQKKFQEKYGVKLGFMSFFTKAVTEALKQFPEVNSQLDDDKLISFNYSDIGIAVQTPKGLMVPVVRSAESMNIPEIELKIAELAAKARAGKISLDEMTGGTFTITNGGVFGSLMSTPILNPPQSGILGMHNIVDRPVAVNGKVEIRPMMYIALSYDHRVIDGRSSVGFLVKVKEMIENPYLILLGGENPAKKLLDI